MGLQVLQVNDLEGRLLAGGQLDFGRDSRLQCLLPTGGAQAPTIPLVQPREIIIRHRGGKIVAHGLTEGEKLVRHHGANDVTPTVSRCRLAGAVAKPSRVQPRAAWLQGFPEDVPRAIVFYRSDHAVQFKCPPNRAQARKTISCVTDPQKAQGCGIDGRISLRIFRLALGQLALPSFGGGALFALFFQFTPFLISGMACVFFWGRKRGRRSRGGQSFPRSLQRFVGNRRDGQRSGVAVAITQGGPGALFWMWVCALLGMATKFYTCSLAVMYRGKDADGVEQGGPMYFIREGLGEKWKPLAIFFAACGLFGCLPLLQSNQLTQIVRSMFFEPQGWFVGDAENTGNGLFGLLLAVLVGLVVVGIKRIGSGRFQACSGYGPPLRRYGSRYPPPSCRCCLARFFPILSDAFTGEAVAGGVLGTVIVTGVRRAAFSNEAGMGTEAMAHGAAKTKEPIREGLVAMWGPVIDTLFMCTLTGLVLLVTGVWNSGEEDGVLLTTQAFERALPGVGPYLLLAGVLCLSFSSMLGFSHTP